MKALSVLLLASVCAFGQTAKDPKFWITCQSAQVFSPEGIGLQMYCPSDGTGDFATVKAEIRSEGWEITSQVVTDGALHIQAKKHYSLPMHEVTEKEWQALMARLKMLEKQMRGEAGAQF